MTTDEEHLSEFIRFVSVANQEVCHGQLDEWHMIHRVDTEHPGFLKLEVRGIKGKQAFSFNPACTCDLAEQFVHATVLLNNASTHTEVAQISRFRRNNKSRH